MAAAPLPARCAGVCYPKDGEEALGYFRGFFDGPEAAAWSPDDPAWLDGLPPLGIVAPHIDFRVGPAPAAYSWAFDDWVRRPVLADRYLILGVGHRCSLPWSVDGRGHAAPLGAIPGEPELAAALGAACPFPVAEPEAHAGEHSIEFPLVMLQALRKLRGVGRPFSFLPVLCGGMWAEVAAGKPPAPDSHSARFAAALGRIVAEQGEQLQIIVSIDGCHIGPRFDHPYKVDADRLQDAHAWEEALWERVEARDWDGFFAHLGRDGNARYFDGVGALWLLGQIAPDFTLERTAYAQWFERGDASAVTFTRGILV